MRLRVAMMALVSLLGGAALAADKPLDVRDIMSASQFHATGLDKLTPEQMAAFNAWLASYSHVPAPATVNAVAVAPATPAVALPAAPLAVAPAPATTSEAKFGEEMLPTAARGEPDRIESRIIGTFTGWKGNTVFHLENGQVWQQTDSSIFEITLQNPPVVIKSLTLGYVLSIPGHGAGGSVFVRRIH